MSWAAHDPEGWDDVCKAAILDKMREKYILRPVQWTQEECSDALEEVLGSLTQHPVWAALVDWANDKIGNAEADHFSGGA